MRQFLAVRFLALFGGCCALLPSSLAGAAGDYTYVKSSLGFPWFMFFVFLALVAIPFLLIIFLTRKKQGLEQEHEKPGGEQATDSSTERLVGDAGIRRFNHIALPLILIAVAVVTWLMVTNAFQANELMERNGRATPTILNPGVR